MRNRAYRRHTEQRQKNRVKNYLKNIWPHVNGHDLSEDPRQVGKHSRVRGLCSCPMCGNPRKYFNKKTRQETIMDIANKYAAEECMREGQNAEDEAFIEKVINIIKQKEQTKKV